MRPLHPRRHSRADRRLLHATEAAWPFLAGGLTAVGLVGSALQYGPVGLGLIYPATALFAMVMLYAAYAESGTSGIPIVRIGLVAALVLIVLLGVLALFPVAGWFAAAFAAATSPLVTGRLAGSRRRASRGSTSATTASARHDQAIVDRAFQVLVAELENDPSWRRDGD
jgi:hypothetical protein